MHQEGGCLHPQGRAAYRSLLLSSTNLNVVIAGIACGAVACRMRLYHINFCHQPSRLFSKVKHFVEHTKALSNAAKLARGCDADPVVPKEDNTRWTLLVAIEVTGTASARAAALLMIASEYALHQYRHIACRYP